MFKKIVLVGLSAFVAGVFAQTPACTDTQAWVASEITEYRFKGAKVAEIAPTQTLPHSSLQTVTPVADFMNYALLDSFSSTCDWTLQNVHFRVHRANTGINSWSTLDTALWVSHIDDILIGSSTASWFWFLKDTVGVDGAQVTADSYIMADAPVRWYAHAVMSDTVKNGASTSIYQSGKSRSSIDSASVALNFLTSWQNAEQATGHKYAYEMRLLKVQYKQPTIPTIARPITIAMGVKVLRNGSNWDLQLADLSNREVIIRDISGAKVQQFVTNQGKATFNLTKKGIFVLQIQGMPLRKLMNY